jgi:hypothetical protein
MMDGTAAVRASGNGASAGETTPEPPNGAALATVGVYAVTESSGLRVVEERLRGQVVMALLGLLTLVIVGILVLVGTRRATVGEGLQLLGALGPLVTGLLGAAIAHYFYDQSKQR